MCSLCSNYHEQTRMHQAPEVSAPTLLCVWHHWQWELLAARPGHYSSMFSARQRQEVGQGVLLC